MTFTVRFLEEPSPCLRDAILADISEHLRTIEPDILQQMGGEYLDYWVERLGDVITVIMGGWARPMMEIEVS